MRMFAAALLLLLVCLSPLHAQEEGTALPEEQKLQDINEQLTESKKKLLKTKQEEQAVLSRLVVINKELRQTSSSLQQAVKKIRLNESEISTLSLELNETEKTLSRKETQLRRRISEVYKSSGVNYLQLLFTSSSMSDFLNRLYYFRKIIDFDAELVQGVRGELRQVKRQRSSLEDRNREIRSLARVIEGKKNEISGAAEEKGQLYKSLQQRRKEFETQVAELEQSSKELEVMILKKTAARQGSKVKGSGVLAWPLEGRLTSRFGYRRHPLWGGRHMHTGIDIAAKHGSPIRAADAGEVIFSGWWGGYGKAVVVDHGNLRTTVYAHMSRIYKNVGAIVAKGQTIGLVGSTGYSTGPHLHFEIRFNGKPVDPMKFL